PMIVAEIGWMMMGIVDTIMVGPLGPEAIGAVGVGGIIFFWVAVVGMGLMLGLDALVAQAFGARRLDECHRWLLHAVYLAFLAAPPLLGVLALVRVALPVWGFAPEVLALIPRYLTAVSFSLLPLLLYTAFRRYLQAMNVVRPLMLALVTANLVNAGANWVLIYGHLGAPALGVAGSAWATVVSRIYMMLVLLAALIIHDARYHTRIVHLTLRPQLTRLRELVRLGLPAAGQLVLELGVLALATALAGRLRPTSLAAHHIALNLAGFTYMIPLGLSSAGAVRVGHAVGRLDVHGARSAGWTALALATVFMSGAAVAFVTIPRALLGVFTSDLGVIMTGVSLLFVGAFFQLFDGIQAVATGVLRGLGDTRTAMLTNLAGHWGIGLPIGYALCVTLGWGVQGIWIGLSCGLIVVAVVLLAIWRRRINAVSVNRL
ncbi:MAG: MATE family efflux transporter, partial [Acidobacteria bacterium]|nr:MATE family efflux transporter [Acidobacteriota bacterium]